MIDAADMGPIVEIARQILGDTTSMIVDRAGDGISTFVYRLRRGEETFYLRVLPEAGDSFAPEAHVHTLLRQRGARVPEALYLEHRNEALQRSVMVTTEIGVAPIQWSVYDLVMGRCDVLTVPPFATVVGHGYVDGLIVESILDRGVGRPHTHTPCCCDDDFMRLAPG